MTYLFRRPLPETPLDIIGDVHGEFDALLRLLHRLGYRDDGFHPEGRRLVFVGDLCDRGPDSPAVLEWFKDTSEKEYVQTVLGNHELNILANDPKDGSGWFFDERRDKDAANYAPWQRVSAAEKADLTAFLAEQPLILERKDLRIVHAAWLPESIRKLEEAHGESLTAQYRRYDGELQSALQNAPWYPDYLYEQQHYAPLADNPDHAPPPMPATARYELERSRLHPIRALTSGVERLADAPFFAGGRWRGTTRCAWWNDYRDDIPVIIGHYWRSRRAGQTVAASDLLPEHPENWHGAAHNVFCVDFSIGASWRARKYPDRYTPDRFALAALRFPEKTVWFDDGEIMKTR